jgi:hypothetical protein
MAAVSNLLDASKLVDDALAAASQTAGAQFGKIKDTVKHNAEELADMAIEIAEKRSKNEISAQDADDLFDQHKNSLHMALLETQGLTTLGVEATINAVLNVFITALNTAVGAGLKVL